jgi:hypothetical protein
MSDLDYMSGGGRHDVGGGSFKEDIVDQFMTDLSRVTNNEEEVHMEKYGVDAENDKIEKKAHDMVKEGSAINLDEARQTVIKEVEKDGSASKGESGAESA